MQGPSRETDRALKPCGEPTCGSFRFPGVQELWPAYERDAPISDHKIADHEKSSRVWAAKVHWFRLMLTADGASLTKCPGLRPDSPKSARWELGASPLAAGHSTAGALLDAHVADVEELAHARVVRRERRVRTWAARRSPGRASWPQRKD